METLGSRKEHPGVAMEILCDAIVRLFHTGFIF